MPSFFNHLSGNNVASFFEIRLENDIIVFRGEADDASSQMLKGHVVLCLPTALKVQDVHLRMSGVSRVGWTDQRITPTGMSTNKTDRNTEIFSHKWQPFVGGSGSSSSKGTTLPAGNYEWPFELVLKGNEAESVEGLSDCYIKYHLKATVARGKLAHDLHAHKAVRLVRTLDPSALELAHAMTVENVWPNKIEYQLEIPQKAIVFGTSIGVEMKFTSLLKGLRIGNIKCQLVEIQEFSVKGATPSSLKSWKTSRDIGTWNFALKDEHYHDMLNESGQDGYSLKEVMPLPKSLQYCLQDVDVQGIKIRHKVKFSVALHNPDGHTSELRATLPVTIFISPNMPINPDGSLVDQTPLSTQTIDVASHAPPLYGAHVLDQLYADIDESGIMTPAPQSGMNTPYFSALSRSGSHENLASLSSNSSNGAVPPAALSSRLQNLNVSSRNSSYRRLHPGTGSGTNTPYPVQQSDGEPAGYFDQHSHSGHSSIPLSRRVSEEENHGGTSNARSGHHTPEHVDFSELGDLSKVPSYSTAIKTPVRGMSYSNALPDYQMATSTPPSPVQGFSVPVSPGPDPANPSTNGASSRSNTITNGAARTNPLSSMGFTPINHPAPVYNGDTDERRRLQLLRQRERSS